MTLGTLTQDLYRELPDEALVLLVYALLAYEAGAECRPWVMWGEA